MTSPEPTPTEDTGLGGWTCPPCRRGEHTECSDADTGTCQCSIDGHADPVQPVPTDVDRPADGPTTDDLAELRKLHEAGTPGPWDITLDERAWSDPTGEHYAQIDWTIHPQGVMGDYEFLLAGVDDRGEFDQVRADVRLAAAARNALPGLLAEVERLRELVGQHDPTGADHMAEMWEHAQRADAAEAEVERLRARPTREQIVDEIRVAYYGPPVAGDWPGNAADRVMALYDQSGPGPDA